MTSKQTDNAVTVGDAVTLPTNNPGRLLELAITQGAGVDQLGKLMDLQERWQAQQSKELFFQALSKFQHECPPINKSKGGYDDRYFYAPLDKTTEIIKPVLYKCGLTYRWEQQETEKQIAVNCIITHIAGHSETTQLTGEPDGSGSKNAIQARGSTVQYLRRYTLESALGISTTFIDDDACKAVQLISEKQASDLEALISELAANKDLFLKHFKIEHLAELPGSQFKKATAMLETKRK